MHINSYAALLSRDLVQKAERLNLIFFFLPQTD